eukprot:1431867-Pleurochrysis_carterae.AAC.1
MCGLERKCLCVCERAAAMDALQAVKEQLQTLRYHQPLGIESAPLVAALLHDLQVRAHTA